MNGNIERRHTFQPEALQHPLTPMDLLKPFSAPEDTNALALADFHIACAEGYSICDTWDGRDMEHRPTDEEDKSDKVTRFEE